MMLDMDTLLILRVILVAVFSVATIFLIRPKKKLKGYFIILLGCAVSIGAVLLGHQFYQRNIQSVFLLLETPGTTRLMMAQIIGYGLVLGTVLRMLVRRKGNARKAEMVGRQ